MSKLGLIFISLLCVLLTTTNAWTQGWTAGQQITLQVNDFALIETNHAPIYLSLSTSIAGAAVTSTSNSDMFVKISSIVSWWRRRDITVSISSGTVPSGTILTLESAECTTANSGGSLGYTVSSPIILSSRSLSDS